MLEMTLSNLKKGSIFFALKGGNFDGNEFASDALEKGAKYAVVDDPKLDGQNNIFLVNNALESLQRLAHDYRNELNATVLAIGGSNGKTTISPTQILFTAAIASFPWIMVWCLRKKFNCT